MNNYLIVSLVQFGAAVIALLALGKPVTNDPTTHFTWKAPHEHTRPTLRRVEKTEAEWKELLTPIQFAIARKHGTERAFSSPLADNHERGTYRCVCCHEPLFTSNTKFESGTGWPSFFAPVRKEVVKNTVDKSYGVVRTEVQCAVCDAHLGHVFPDGPEPTGQRYCMNGAALEFIKKQ